MYTLLESKTKTITASLYVSDQEHDIEITLDDLTFVESSVYGGGFEFIYFPKRHNELFCRVDIITNLTLDIVGINCLFYDDRDLADVECYRFLRKLDIIKKELLIDDEQELQMILAK